MPRESRSTPKATHINVLGASGSGVSSVGRAVAAALAVPYFDSDDYFHAPTDPPFQRARSPEERSRLIDADLAVDRDWVLGGGVALQEPLPSVEFSLVVFLTAPTAIRLERLRQREFERFGARIRPGGDMHAIHEEFLAWAGRYDEGGIEGKTLARHERYLASASCPVLRASGLRPVESVLGEVLSAVGS